MPGVRMADANRGTGVGEDEPVTAREERLKRNLEYLGSRLPAGGAVAERSQRRALRGKAAVVCWDLSHNPAGRAHVLARLLHPHWEVELTGPIWPRFGDSLWEPLRGSGIAWRGLPVTDLADLIVQAGALALARHYDLVVVSKPRLPGLLLGLFLAEQSRCPLVFDFDEDERAFLQHHQEDPAESAAKLLAEPFGTTGTLLAAQYWNLADAVTVASPALRRAHGGHLVRHARDETAPLADRDAARQRLGFAPDDLVLAFIGTVRAHKGLDRVLAAMEAIADPRLKLLVAGSVDAGMRSRLARLPGQVSLFPPCDLGELGGYLAAADLVPLLQDPGAAIAQSQFPAKVTDALQHGIPIVAIATPPLSDGSLEGVADWIPADGLAAYLQARLAAPPMPATRRAFIRQVFEDEYGEGINRVRLDTALGSALRAHNPFDRTKAEALRGLMEAIRRARGKLPATGPASPALAARRGGYDVAFFWKQNDSGLFGRRADLMADHLLRTGQVRRVVHFDHALHAASFGRMARDHLAGRQNSAAMQFRPQALRALGLSDTPDFRRRLILTPAGNGPPGFGGQPHILESRVPEAVAAALREAGCDPARTIAWLCPVVRDFPAIAAQFPFHRLVVDLIDDQRTWARTPEEWARVNEAYAAALQRADLVLTNAEGNRANFAALRGDIHLVPNGAELTPPAGDLPLPGWLREGGHPVIGYAGNLSERIDWPLLQALATGHPDWRFVLIGPHGEAGIPPAILACGNILLPGPLPYDQVRRCFAGFDCAIVPHLRNAMTEAMNPLKVYNYLAAGLPVVTTDLANLEGVRGLVTVADGPADFAAAIAAALAAPRRRDLPAEQREAIAWETRMAAVARLLETLG